MYEMLKCCRVISRNYHEKCFEATDALPLSPGHTNSTPTRIEHLWLLSTTCCANPPWAPPYPVTHTPTTHQSSSTGAHIPRTASPRRPVAQQRQCHRPVGADAQAQTSQARGRAGHPSGRATAREQRPLRGRPEGATCPLMLRRRQGQPVPCRGRRPGGAGAPSGPPRAQHGRQALLEKPKERFRV